MQYVYPCVLTPEGAAAAATRRLDEALVVTWPVITDTWRWKDTEPFHNLMRMTATRIG